MQFAAVVVFFIVAKVEFQLPVFIFLAEFEGHFGDERPARFGAKPIQGANLFIGQEACRLGRLKGTSGGRFGEAETAAFGGAFSRTFRGNIRAAAGVATVVFFHHAAAVGAGRLQRGVVAGHGVAVVLLGLLNNVLGHGRNLLHEVVTAEQALFHLRELEFPLAGQLRS